MQKAHGFASFTKTYSRIELLKDYTEPNFSRVTFHFNWRGQEEKVVKRLPESEAGYDGEQER